MRRHPLLILSALGLLAVVVLGAFPVRAYVAQNHERQSLEAQSRSLAAANQKLSDQVKRLQDPEVVEQLARDRYHLVKPGEEAYALLPENRPAAAPAPAAADAGTQADTATQADRATQADSAGGRPHGSWLSRTWARVTSIF